MSIEINTTKLAAQTFQATEGEIAGAPLKKALGALLSGKSLTVADGSMSDLEALVARLKNENERTRFSLLLTSLASISQSMTEVQRKTLEKGLELSDGLEKLETLLESAIGKKSVADAEITILQAKIEALQKLIDQAVADGKEHNKLVAEQKRVREELEAKEKSVAETQDEIDRIKNDIASVKGQISAILKSVGENTIKTIADELSVLAKPEKADRPAETEKTEKKEDANDLFAAIRESLAEIERDLSETIEENRVETV